MHMHAMLVHAQPVQAECSLPAGYFRREQAPNVLLTTCYAPSRLMYHFLADMLEVLPCATFYKRQVSLPPARSAPPRHWFSCRLLLSQVSLPQSSLGMGVVSVCIDWLSYS